LVFTRSLNVEFFFSAAEADGAGGGGDTRKARPCRPVKPLLTICVAKATSVAQVLHFRMLGCVMERRAGWGWGVEDGFFWSAALRRPLRLLAAGEEGMKCGTEGDVLGEVAADEVGEELSEGTV
jgi:hypothetical protein